MSNKRFVLVFLGLILYWLVATPIVVLYITTNVLLNTLSSFGAGTLSTIFILLALTILILPIILLKKRFRVIFKGKRIWFFWVALVFAVFSFHSLMSVMGISQYYSDQLNNFSNRFVDVDRSCVVDSDCVMKQVDCSPCEYGSRGDAVNKNYNPSCPVPEPGIMCPMLVPQWMAYEVACEDNQCIKVGDGTFKVPEPVMVPR